MVTRASGTLGTMVKFALVAVVLGPPPGKSSLELAKRLGGAVKPLCRRV